MFLRIQKQHIESVADPESKIGYVFFCFNCVVVAVVVVVVVAKFNAVAGPSENPFNGTVLLGDNLDLDESTQRKKR